MRAAIEPGKIQGNISAPASKSMTQRVFAAALLHSGKTRVHHAGASADEMAAFGIIRQLGASIVHTDIEDQSMEITGGMSSTPPDSISCGESGLAARLFTPIAALHEKEIRIDGTGTLLQRPMTGFEEALQHLGVSVRNFNGYLPVTVCGPIQARSLTVNTGDSSQLVSGLLFALSARAKEPLIITVPVLKSLPYIDLTLEVLEQFGKPVTHKDYKEFYIDPTKFEEKNTVDITVGGDWSSAAYFLVAGAIAGEMTVGRLDMASKQADRAIMDILKMAGATVAVDGDRISVNGGSLKGFEYDATESPDLFPVLSILAACCEGESYIKGIHRLFNKESDRVESISAMLQNFMVPFSLGNDTLCIEGITKLRAATIDSYKDHRIAMAAAIGALRAAGTVEILDANSVNKSYPAFFSDLRNCGVKLTYEL